MNWESKGNIMKWKVSKRAQKICPSKLDGGGGACVCLSACLCVCLFRLKSWIIFYGVKGSCWDFQDQSNHVQVIFGQGSQISQPQGYIPFSHQIWKIINWNTISISIVTGDGFGEEELDQGSCWTLLWNPSEVHRPENWPCQQTWWSHSIHWNHSDGLCCLLLIAKNYNGCRNCKNCQGQLDFYFHFLTLSITSNSHNISLRLFLF